VSDAEIAEHRGLIERLFPSLQLSTFRPIGAGWTVFTYEVNGDTIVQLPRSSYAAERLRAQIAVLPELARELPVPVPVPLLASDDPPAIVYRKLDGVPFPEASDGPWPERLGRAVQDLHAVAPEFVGLRATSADAVMDAFADRLAVIADLAFPLLEPVLRDRLARRFDRYTTHPEHRRFGPCVTHGDLAPEHVLVGPDGELAGVLDWEELAVDDPVLDLAWLLHARPADGERVLAAYGGAPDGTFRDRAAFRYVLMPFHDVLHGLDTGEERWIAEGLEGIRAREAAVP